MKYCKTQMGEITAFIALSKCFLFLLPYCLHCWHILVTTYFTFILTA